MFKWLGNYFTEQLGVENTGENMSYDNRATIRQMKNGKFRLLANGNEVVATYSRRRDALRGAQRRGLSLG